LGPTAKVPASANCGERSGCPGQPSDRCGDNGREAPVRGGSGVRRPC
jgi:hypothetical protein